MALCAPLTQGPWSAHSTIHLHEETGNWFDEGACSTHVAHGETGLIKFRRRRHMTYVLHSVGPHACTPRAARHAPLPPYSISDTPPLHTALHRVIPMFIFCFTYCLFPCVYPVSLFPLTFQ